MAGGTWVDQNKVRPGVYINYKSAPSSLATMGERGTVAIARVLDWGERGRWYTITDPSDCEQFGHAITDDECLFIRQILLGSNRTQGASKILLWSLATPGGGITYASGSGTVGTSKTLTVTAKKSGPTGNSLSVSLLKNGATSTDVTVTLSNGNETISSVVFEQMLANGGQGSVTKLNNEPSFSQYVVFSGDDVETVPSGSPLKIELSGGVNGSAKATATLGNLTATAKYVGTFGNRLSVVITAGASSNFIVQTLLDGQAVDSQVVSAISGLVSNDYIDWSGTGALAVNTGVALTGGTNGEAGLTNYSDFLDALELEQFNIVIYDGESQSIKDAYIDFVKRLSNNEGSKCQAVISGSTPNPDNECVINCYPQALTLSDGSQLSASEMTWWVGGAEAGANVNESLTYVTHPNAVDFQPKLNSAAQEAAINAGQIAFISNKGNVKVLTDINSFRTYAVEKGKAFSKNRVIRTVFGLCNDIYDVFSTNFIGAVDNDEEGRKSLKGEIIGLMNRYQGIRALQNVEADDVTVLKGVDSDAVVIEIYCQPVDSVEKIYVNITIH